MAERCNSPADAGHLEGYGQTGPYRKAAGYDVVIEGAFACLALSWHVLRPPLLGEAGLMHITGEPDKPPCKVGVAVTDISTGLYAHGAILAALLSRQQTGKGLWIDCNLFDTQVCAPSHAFSAWLMLAVDSRTSKHCLKLLDWRR